MNSHRAALFAVNVNGVHIGTMILTAAHMVATAMCAKMGDVVTVDDNIPCDDWYYDTNPYRTVTTYTYFHNGNKVAMCEEVCDENEVALDHLLTDNVRKLHTGQHAKALSGFKYDKSDGGRSRRTAWAFSKRAITRSTRRVGKMLTKYDIDCEG
jgi:hypothetical protein